MTGALLLQGTGVPEPLSGAIRSAAGRNLLSLTLESVHGPILHAGPDHVSSAGTERDLKALPVLSDEQKSEKRFLFAMTDRHWEVLSAFTIDSRPYYTRVTLDISDPAGAPLRSGIFKIADYFTTQCRKHLQSFINVLVQRTTGTSPSDVDITFERSILEKAMTFSSQIQCALVLGEDGYIVHAEGSAGPVDGLAAALAPLYYRSSREIAALGCADCSAITLADREYTIRTGRIAGTALLHAVSAAGPSANAIVNFTHAAVSDALSEYGWRTGQLWGVKVAGIPLSSRVRTSWFADPELVPQGRFVMRRGSNAFHTSACPILAGTDTALLSWFNEKDEAARGGLRPCGTCNP
jgi:hypothetical protein